jgi:hypothetical protein
LRLNVLVQAEKILGVVLSLDGREPVAVGTKSSFDGIFPLVTQEIQQVPTAGEGTYRLCQTPSSDSAESAKSYFEEPLSGFETGCDFPQLLSPLLILDRLDFGGKFVGKRKLKVYSVSRPTFLSEASLECGAAGKIKECGRD